MIPKLRFSEFTESWYEVSIGDIASVSRGRFSPRPRNDPRYYGGNTEFIQTSEVVGANPNILNGLKSLNEEGVRVSKVFPSGTIVMTIAANIGYVGFANRPVAFPDSLVGINAFEDILPKYLFYVLSRKQRRLDYIAEEAAQKNITSPTVRKFKIWHTTNLKEQVALTNLFELVNKKINLLTKKKEALEAYKKGLMQKIFSQELRYKREDGTDFDLWNDFKFETICKRENSGLTNRELAPEGIIAVYGAAGNIEGYSDGHAQPSSYVSIVKDGAGVGRVRLLKKDTSTTGTLDIIIPDVEHVTAHFLYLMLSTIKWNRYMVGSTIPHIYFRDWKKLRVCVPSVKEQIKISSVISNIEKQIVLLNGNIGKVQKLKKGLLQQMFI